MAERRGGVQIVWSEADWPSGSPIRDPGQVFAALPAPVPQQRVRQVAVACGSGQRLDDLLADWLTPAARAAIDEGRAGVAVYGRRARPGLLLHDADRVELLGPITADPQSARRHRVSKDREGDPRHLWRPRGGTKG